MIEYEYDLIKQPTKERETNMFIYQNDKQRKSSEDIERRFPTIKNPDIRSVYLQTLRTPEP